MAVEKCSIDNFVERIEALAIAWEAATRDRFPDLAENKMSDPAWAVSLANYLTYVEVDDAVTTDDKLKAYTENTPMALLSAIIMAYDDGSPVLLTLAIEAARSKYSTPNFKKNERD